MKYLSENLTKEQKVAMIRKQMSYPEFLTFRMWVRWYRLPDGTAILEWR